MRAFGQRILLALATGAIFTTFSELMFWGSYDFAGKLNELLFTWLMYSLLAYMFLGIIRAFRVHNLWALFLAGAIYGWLDEGVIVQTMYDSFPLQISWTGLSWHALLTVCTGWYLIRKALLEPRISRLLWVSVATGLTWGAWSTWWWTENGTILPLESFMVYSVIIGAILIMAYWVSNLIPPASFQPSRTEQIVVTIALLLYFAFLTVPRNPYALLLLPPCLALSCWALFRHRNTGEGTAIMLDELSGNVVCWRYLCLALLPLSAIITYAVFLLLNAKLPTGMVLYAVTVPVGFIFFIISMVKLLRSSPQG